MGFLLKHRPATEESKQESPENSNFSTFEYIEENSLHLKDEEKEEEMDQSDATSGFSKIQLEFLHHAGVVSKLSPERQAKLKATIKKLVFEAEAEEQNEIQHGFENLANLIS